MEERSRRRGRRDGTADAPIGRRGARGRPARRRISPTRARCQILTTEHWSLLSARSLVLQRGVRAGRHVPDVPDRERSSPSASSRRAAASRATFLLFAHGRCSGSTCSSASPRSAGSQRPAPRRSSRVAGDEPHPPRLPRDGAGPRAVLQHEPPRRSAGHRSRPTVDAGRSSRHWRRSSATSCMGSTTTPG